MGFETRPGKGQRREVGLVLQSFDNADLSFTFLSVQREELGRSMKEVSRATFRDETKETRRGAETERGFESGPAVDGD